MKKIHAWTDSMVVLSWLHGNPGRFKTFILNQVSEVIDLVLSSCWHHVSGTDNSADCASRAMLPTELIQHRMQWYGPD